jgi:signal transduction histidine kinase
LSQKARFNWWGFTWQLFLVTVLPLTVLVLLVAFGSQSLHHDAMRSLVGDRDLRSVRAAVDSLEQEIMHRVSTIQMLARESASQAGFQGLSLSDDEIGASFDGGIALFSAKRDLLQTSHPAGFWSNVSQMLPAYFDSLASSTQSPIFSAPLPSSGENKTYILVGTLTPDRQFLLGAFSPPVLVQDTLNVFVGTGQMTAILVGRKGAGPDFEILHQVGPSRADEHLLTHPGIQESLNGESGISYFHTAEGEHVIAYSAVPHVGWGLIIEEAWEDIASPSLITSQAAPLVVVPVFLLALVALWYGARRIVRPLQMLEKQAADLAGGNFAAIRKPVGGIEEIRNLQAELIDMAEKLSAAQQSLHGYIGAMTAGIENERRSLARELHDDTIQSLIALNQRIQLAAKNLSPTDANEERFAKEALELQTLTQETITNLRRTIRGLRPIYLEDLGLAASLEILVNETSQAASIPITFKVLGAERRLDPQIEMSLYRMVQESLNNIAHHSQAAQGRVELTYSPAKLQLSIQDNGKGFIVPSNPAEFPKKGHFGLLGLQERAEIIGAEFHISSKPGQGTTVTIELRNP